MRLSQKALEAIKKPEVRIQLALVLGCTDQTIIKYIRDNDDNLTKAAVLVAIKKQTGLTDAELLEVEKTKKTA